MATLNVSDHYNTPGNWGRPDPNYTMLLNTVGAGSASGHDEVTAALLNTATR